MASPRVFSVYFDESFRLDEPLRVPRNRKEPGYKVLR